MPRKRIDLNSTFTVLEKDFDGAEESILIEGYANTVEKDRMGDIVQKEAWLKGGIDNFLKNPIVLAFHDHSRPIGQVLDYSVSERGLKVVAEISKAAGEVFQLVKKGILKSFSVGFAIKDAEYDNKNDIFYIKDLELLEVSVVSVPANASSTFSVAKSFSNDSEFEEFKKQFLPEEVEVKADESAEAEEELEEPQDLVNKEEKSMPDIQVTEGVEKLLADIASRLEKVEAAKKDSEQESQAVVSDLTKEIEDLRSQLTEKSSEIESFQKRKILFEEREAAEKVSQKEIDTAIIVAKALGRPVGATSYAGKLVQKAGAHLSAMTEDWEQAFTTKLEEDIRERLVMEPLFRKVAMPTPTFNIPVNPEAGLGEWIASTSFRTSASTGNAVDHTITDIALNSYKVVAKEYLGYEEDEDSIIPLVPIIRDAVVRRMARTIDIALLRGPGSVTHPINGVAKLAADAGNEDQLSIAGGDKVKVSDLQASRRRLGVRGIDPSDVIYIVSHDAYFDLLEDTDFRTMDLVGERATIIRGQLGAALGSPVIVSGEFENKAATKYAAVCVNTQNFMVGTHRNLMVESDRDIEEQKRILVASRRLAFRDIITSAGASVITWDT